MKFKICFKSMIFFSNYYYFLNNKIIMIDSIFKGFINTYSLIYVITYN